MPDPIDTTILDPETLARMDEEFLAGKYDAIDLPPVEALHPQSDPFGMGYEWLDPTDDLAVIFAQVAGRFPSDLYRAAAGELRRLNLSASFASGTDRELLDSWVQGNFLSLCRSVGGDLTERIRLATAPSWELTREAIRVLQKLPDFDELEPAQQITVAFAAVDSAREHLRPK
jgi:hypothetical protein